MSPLVNTDIQLNILQYCEFIQIFYGLWTGSVLDDGQVLNGSQNRRGLCDFLVCTDLEAKLPLLNRENTPPESIYAIAQLNI